MSGIPYAVKSDFLKNFPDLSRALAEELVAEFANVYELNSMKVDKGDLVADMRDFSGFSFASSDNTAPIQAAIDAVSAAGGGAVMAPIGGPINFAGTLSGKAGVRLTGQSRGASAATTTGGEQGPRLVYTGAGAPALNLDGIQNWSIDHLALMYSNAALNSPLVTMRNGGTGTNCAFWEINSCFFGSTVPSTNRSATMLFDMRGTVQGKVSNSRFYGAGSHLHGLDPSYGGTQVANTIRVESSFFKHHLDHAIMNPGQGWDIVGCSAEPNTSGAAAFLKVETPSTHPAGGVSIIGGWGGDNTVAGQWIKFGGKGLSVLGGSWNLGSGSSLIKLTGDTVGLAVIATDLRGAAGYVVDPNGFTWTNVFLLSEAPSGQAVAGNAWPTLGQIAQQNVFQMSGLPKYLNGAKINTASILSGAGSPEGSQAASPGSLYLMTTGALYLKTTGTGTTGWVLK